MEVVKRSDFSQGHVKNGIKNAHGQEYTALFNPIFDVTLAKYGRLPLLAYR